MAHWTASDMPDLKNKVALVTGATSGIGEAAAHGFAQAGAAVVLAIRDVTKGEATKAAIMRKSPLADVRIIRLDLADLESVREFADRAVRALPQIDILLNNAGLGLQRKRTMTKDGFERQFGTNHLGHFALTGLLLPALGKAAAPRVVTISSIAHRRGRVALSDLHGENGYSGLAAYSQSKLANLMFALELDRRAKAAGSRIVSVAAHPGLSSTGFLEATEMPRPLSTIAGLGVGVAGQSAVSGALPGLYAATMPDVTGGSYWGPSGFQELRGTPAPARIAPHAQDREAAQRLWAESERLTGVDYRRLDGRGN